MKANAPEKLYVELFKGEWNVSKSPVVTSVEYIRTDAFIEKACVFLQDRIEHDSIDYPMATHWLIDDFKKYMEESKV